MNRKRPCASVGRVPDRAPVVGGADRTAAVDPRHRRQGRRVATGHLRGAAAGAAPSYEESNQSSHADGASAWDRRAPSRGRAMVRRDRAPQGLPPRMIRRSIGRRARRRSHVAAGPLAVKSLVPLPLRPSPTADGKSPQCPERRRVATSSTDTDRARQSRRRGGVRRHDGAHRPRRRRGSSALGRDWYRRGATGRVPTRSRTSFSVRTAWRRPG